MSKKRTSLDRALDRKREFEGTIQSIWSEASRNGYTHDWILKEITHRVHEHPNYNKLPQWVKSALQQTSWTWLIAAQTWRLTTGYEHEGVFYTSNWDNFPEALKERCRTEDATVLCKSIWLPQPQFKLDRPTSEVKEF